MGRKYAIILSVCLLLGTLWIEQARAQAKYAIDTQGSEMTITGTSTVHDWTSKVNTINANVLFKSDQTSSLSKGSLLNSLSLSIPVKSIESPRGSTMDKKTYDALKSDKHPNITFDLVVNDVTQVSGNSFKIKATGKLNIAGKSKDVNMTLDGTKEGSAYSFKGSHTLNMKEYDMEPPTAMFGAIVVGEEVTIDFNIKFKPA